MARDYVTIRGERQGDQVLWREKNVSRMNLKSIVARVVRRPDGSLWVMGAAWNDGFTPLQAAELRIDGGPWQPAAWGEGLGVPHAWMFWSYDWKSPPAGEHTLVSRARDVRGRVQPAPDDDGIALKKTYWEAISRSCGAFASEPLIRFLRCNELAAHARGVLAGVISMNRQSLKLWASGLFFFSYVAIQIAVPIADGWPREAGNFTWSMYSGLSRSCRFDLLFPDGRRVSLRKIQRGRFVGRTMGRKLDVARYVPPNVCEKLDDIEAVVIIREGEEEIYPCP